MNDIGVFTFATKNLGDEMQSYAVLQHLRRVGAFLDRDHLADFDGPENTLCVFNSRFLVGDDFRAPSPKVRPVWYGFGISKDELLQGEWLDYLKANAPIGCRDLYTTERLTAVGVPAYWSGCLTLFLGRGWPQAQERSGILFVDVPPEAEALLPQELTLQAQRFSTFAPPSARYRPLERWATVAALIERLRTAELVVTRRLHVALPCVGFGTPVFAIPDPEISQARFRFSGFDRFVPTIYLDEIENLIPKVDWRTIEPATIPAELLERHDDLTRRLAKSHAGTESGWPQSPLDDPNRFQYALATKRLGRRPTQVRLRLGRQSFEIDTHLWSDREIHVGLRGFPGLSRFDFRVEMGPKVDGSWIDLGTLADLVLDQPPGSPKNR